MTKILPTINNALDLHPMSLNQLEQVADEIRETLCNLLRIRAAHFASNLGVVELTLALHSTYDFLQDRLIWDCLLYTSPSPRDQRGSRMPSSA